MDLPVRHDIEHLNADCTCVTLDRDRMCLALVDAVGDAAFCNELTETHPNLISARQLFLTAEHTVSRWRQQSP